MTTRSTEPTDISGAQAPLLPERRRVAGTLVGGAIGGTVAGLAFAGMTMWLMSTQGMPIKLPLLAIATIVQGEDSLGTASPVLGAGLHMVLSAAFGMVLAFLVCRLNLKSDAGVIVTGASYGLILYVVNFVALGHAVFAVFTRLNQPFQVLNHMIFGILVSLVIGTWRTRSERGRMRE